MVTVNKGVNIEWVGEDALVMPRLENPTHVIKVTGSTARTLRALISGQTVAVESLEVNELVRHGIVTVATRPGLSRRDAIFTGATIGVAGLTMMTLPSAAASSSGEVNQPEPTLGGDGDEPLPVPIPVASPGIISPLANSSHGLIVIKDRFGTFDLELPVVHIDNYASIVTDYPSATFEVRLDSAGVLPQRFDMTEGKFSNTGFAAPSISTDPDTSGFFRRPSNDNENFMGGSSGFHLRIRVGDKVSKWTDELNPPVIFSVRWNGTTFPAG